MSIQTLFNLKSKFVSREVGDDLILVPLSNNVAQMNELFTLNETGKFIWNNIGDNSTIEDLKSAMTASFVIDADSAERDINIFLNQLENLLSKK